MYSPTIEARAFFHQWHFQEGLGHCKTHQNCSLICETNNRDQKSGKFTVVIKNETKDQESLPQLSQWDHGFGI